jgi:hypothetical protein
MKGSEARKFPVQNFSAPSQHILDKGQYASVDSVRITLNYEPIADISDARLQATY